MIEAFDRRFRPRDLLLVAPPGTAQQRLAQHVPFVGPLAACDGNATAYVCVNYACHLPVTDAAAFAAALETPGN